MIQFSNKWTCFFVTRGHLFCDTRTVSHQNWCTPLNLTNMSHIFSSNHKNIEIMKNCIDFDNMGGTWCSSNTTFHKGQKWLKKPAKSGFSCNKIQLFIWKSKMHLIRSANQVGRSFEAYLTTSWPFHIKFWQIFVQKRHI